MKRVLRGKIGKRRPRRSVLDREPSRLRSDVRVKLRHHRVKPFEEFRIARCFIKCLLGQHSQHAQGIVVALAPSLQVQRRKHITRLAMPAPPQIVGKPLKPANAFR